MKRCFLVFLILINFGAISIADETADQIIAKSESLMRGKTQIGTYKMIISDPDWERSIKMRFWIEGNEKSFIRILEPKKDRNVTFLKLKGEMWQFIPKVNRTIKIPPSMMLQRWMGSDFTNDDLVKESSEAKDYTHKLIRKIELDGDLAFEIELTPRRDAPVVWAKIVEWIRVDDYVPLKAEYFSERGELIRTLKFSEIKKMSDRTLPTRIELISTKKPKNRTIIILENVKFDQPISPKIFTRQNLRRSK